jgi:hypothetical protein
MKFATRDVSRGPTQTSRNRSGSGGQAAVETTPRTGLSPPRKWFRAFAAHSFLACRPPTTPGNPITVSSRTAMSAWPSPRVDRLGTPKDPAIRFTRAVNFGATWFTHSLRPVRLLAPLDGSDWDTPALGGFYFQAFNRSVSLPVAGYHYNSDWTSSVGGTLTR